MEDPIALPVGLTLLRRLPLPHALGLLERLYGGALSRRGVAWVRTAPGPIWKLDLSDSSQRWIVFGDYEGPAQMRWIRRWLDGGGVLVDSGANIGQMLLYLAPLPGVSVHAFEPIPTCARWIRDCLRVQTGCRVEVVELALSDRAQELEIQVAGPRSTTRQEWYSSQNLPRLTISAVRLDDYAEAHEIDAVRLWKLDVEGGKIEAIAGAERLLGRSSIDAALIETSRRTWDAVSTNMASHRYSPYLIDAHSRLRPVRRPLSETRDVLFLAPSFNRRGLAAEQ